MARPKLTEYDDDILQIARRISLEAESDPHLRGRWALETLRKEVKKELGILIPRLPVDGPVSRLIARGDIVQYPAHERPADGGNGRMRVYRATGIDTVTLSTLIQAASDSISADVASRRGRRGEREDWRVEHITSRQFNRIRTMGRHVAFFLTPLERDDEQAAFGEVGSEYFHWDPAAADWRPFVELIKASRPPRERLETDIGAARLLLNLAAARGLILRAERGARHVVPTEWAPVQAAWLADAEHPGVAAVYACNFILSCIADLFGADADPRWLTEEATLRLVKHIQDVLLADKSLTHARRTSVRRTLRTLMATSHLPTVDVNSWDYRQRNRQAAWSSAISKRITAVMGANRRGAGVKQNAYVVWREFPFPELANPDNPYSLVRAVDFQTAVGLERTRLGFRALGSFARIKARKSSSRSETAWSEKTLFMVLGLLSIYLGWVRRNGGVDMATADLRHVFTTELLHKFVDECDQGLWSTRENAMRVLIYVGQLCAPHLEAAALGQGDNPLSRRFFDLSCLATGRGALSDEIYDGRPLYDQLEQSIKAERLAANTGIKTEREQAEKGEKAYTEVFGVEWAFEGMELMFRAACRTVLRNIGVASFSELRERWAELSLTRTELVNLRALAYWNFGLAAPIRTKAMVGLEVSMIKQRFGRITTDIPATLMKWPANGDYRVTVSSEDHQGYEVALWEVYIMAGGVRDQLLRGPRNRGVTDRVWVNDFCRGRTSRAEVLPATINSMAKTIVDLAAVDLGLTTEQVAVLRDATHNHSVRHALAGRLVNDGRMEEARILLHHAGYDMLLKVYARRGEKASTGSLRASIGNDPECALLARVRSANAEELEAIKAFLTS